MIVAVYGLGRFGSFWARELASHFTVIGWSRNPDRPTPEGVRRATEDEVLNAEVLILCVAISAIEGVLKRISGKLRAGTLVMDTCSVKMHPSNAMMRLLPNDIDILATHPMFGPDSGENGLKNLPLVFSPLRIDSERAQFWRRQFSSMGLKVMEMSPESHDREAAYSQGITHFIGRVLGAMELNESTISTTGYRHLLDIVRQTCNDPWRLFVDLQRFNPYTLPMRRDLHRAINAMLVKFDSIDIEQGGFDGGDT